MPSDKEEIVRSVESSRDSESEPEVVQAVNGDEAEEEKPADDPIHALSGIANLKPLDNHSNGEEHAVQLGATKLVSKWHLHRCDYGSCPDRWAEFETADDEMQDLTMRAKGVPIIHRQTFGDKKWHTHSITIQDTSMRQVLQTVLAKYQDLDLELINWTFDAPYMPLVHRWEELKSHYNDLEAGPTKIAAAALLAFLAPIVAPSVLSQAQIRRTGKVSFGKIWQIFPPGSIVKTKFYGVDTICRVTKYREENDGFKPPSWVIDMEYVDWNGERSGWTTTSLTIWQYSGFMRVTGLPVFPISFSNNESKLREDMIERGRKWANLRGYHFVLANGSKIQLETETAQQRPVSGKVCVDAYAYYRSCNIIKPALRPLKNFVKDKEDDGVEADDGESLGAEGYVSSFAVAQVESKSKAESPDERNEDLSPLTEEELMMTTPWVKGFDLKSKGFCALNVSDLQPMIWNDEAFEKLVLPGGEKELAWAFVENKSQYKTTFDDFVADKGRGLIILMFGPPGVGKTFTAEAVAERSRVPLYSMSAGDLGTQPAEVEKALERALELCRMWNAMMLLDEADVFLGERTNESLARNELVSIFLTKLEYYQGILFLTTNRISSIDHAFQSRVDLFLPYRDLTTSARRQVWDNFIERAGKHKFELDEDSLDSLSELKLNGREIKNLIKSAQLLSLKDSGKVPVDRLLLLADKRVQALKELD